MYSHTSRSSIFDLRVSKGFAGFGDRRFAAAEVRVPDGTPEVELRFRDPMSCYLLVQQKINRFMTRYATSSCFLQAAVWEGSSLFHLQVVEMDSESRISGWAHQCTSSRDQLHRRSWINLDPTLSQAPKGSVACFCEASARPRSHTTIWETATFAEKQPGVVGKNKASVVFVSF